MFMRFKIAKKKLHVDIDQGIIHKGKSKVARNEKRKKLHGFLIHKIWQILKHFAGTFC